MRPPCLSVSQGGTVPKDETRVEADMPNPSKRLTYQSKVSDPYSSHSVILAHAGDGKGRKLLDVGAAQGVLAQRFTQRPVRSDMHRGERRLAALGKSQCHEMIVADLVKPLPALERDIRHHRLRRYFGAFAESIGSVQGVQSLPPPRRRGHRVGTKLCPPLGAARICFLAASCTRI